MSRATSNPTGQVTTQVYTMTNCFKNGCLNRHKSSNEKFHSFARWKVIFAFGLLLLLTRKVNSLNQHRDESDSDTSSLTNCTKCSLLLEDAKISRLEQFKREFLYKLGFKEAPKVAVDKSIYNIPPLDSLFAHERNKLANGMMLGDQPYNPEAETSKSHLQNDLDDSQGNIRKVISFAKLPPKSLNVSADWNAQYFQFSHSLANSHISRATLWINVWRPPNVEQFKNDDDEDEEDAPYSHINENQIHNRNKELKSSEQGSSYGWIVVDQLRLRSINSDLSQSGPSLSHVRSRRIHITSGTSWVKLSVKKLVNQWLHEQNENLALVIHVYDSEGHILPIGSACSDKYRSLQVPFIELKMDHLSQNRHKRRANQNFCDGESRRERPSCCLHPFTVDFKQFGWDWVIAPTFYQANYCTGECHEFDASTYMHVMKQAKGSHSRCCVPKKTSDLQIIYLDEEGNLYSKLIPDMKIEKCGCA